MDKRLKAANELNKPLEELTNAEFKKWQDSQKPKTPKK